MYKLVIVDDEVLVREAIKCQTNWAELGFECVGDCEDGEDALAFMAREQVDVVLTDIGMPFMDGLELTRELSVKNPAVKVIILTGYDDFDYAQQAVKLQTVDYILKPITPSELGAVLLKLRAEMDGERNKERDYEQLKRQLAENMPVLKERFLERMTTAKMSDKEKSEGWDYFQLAWEGDCLIELAMDVDEFKWDHAATVTDEQLIRFAVFNVAQELIGAREGTEVFRDRENRVLALLSGDDPAELQERALLTAEEVHQAVTAILPAKLSIGIGCPCGLRDDIPSAHQTALSALEYRFVIGSNTIIRLSDLERREKPGLLAVVAWENELATRLKTGTLEEIDQWVDRLFAAIREQLLPLPVCQMYLQRIVLTLMHTFYELDHGVTPLAETEDSPLSELAALGSLDNTQAWMRRLCRKAVTVIRSMRENQSAVQVTKAIAYVKEHYRNPELSLISVCKHISMSPSYFSVLFKQHTGKTFIEFVTQERMERAKELLGLTAMKSYEIAYEVGYSDPHYFSGAFKKHWGDTPTDYRQKLTTKKA
ncbi:response regulator [Paenibacillus rhizovicinus]|uniref:Response regulator n=1 Tax=Paenibacillus rhizovicinus TaxID=2704463 RepID=A0A6C0P8Q7_9BACL|nr:response regulator [Paenibacillus rhizovicinus]QHW34796.1 response regulator [Paenibacillus rhizovicinus]